MQTYFLDPVRSKTQVPDFDRVTGSPESILFFLKSKRRRFSKKTKINGLQPSFWPGLARSTGSPGQQGHTEFFLSLFFLQPGPVPVSSQLNSRSIYQTRPYLKTMHAKILGRKSLHKFEITLIFLPYWSAEDKIKIKIEEEYFKIHLLSLKKTWRKENFEALQITHLNKTGLMRSESNLPR